MAYLQFDGVDNESNSHRKVGNLFDVKLRAIEELYRAGIDVILVVTVVNGVNNDQVGKILQFAVDNPEKITVVSFQPVSFTGRDEDIDDATRMKQRYTLSHLAYDVKAQTGITEPMPRLVPAVGARSLQRSGRSADGREGRLGRHEVRLPSQLRRRHGADGQQEDAADGAADAVLDMEGLLDDIGTITDGAQNKALTVAQLGMALAKNYRPDLAPPGYNFSSLLKQLMSQTGARGGKVGEFEKDAEEFEWRVLFVAGMWFQDLFNYDFRRTEMCIIPYGTQLGEISFCAYNTGIGWRNVVEKMLQNASVAEWYKLHGRHPSTPRGRTSRCRSSSIRSRLASRASRSSCASSGSSRPSLYLS